ncbi:RNA recognition motif protein, partial [Gregarina niphandrodes]
PPSFVSPAERRQTLQEERRREHAEQLERRRVLYEPSLDPSKQKTADAKKTLFVGRLSYETTEKKLLKTFEAYGPVRDIRVVADLEGKPRGYAFVEFKNEEGMWNAYKNANQKVIDGRAVLVDTEKARVVSGWLPRRLGGGEGPPRKGVKVTRAADHRTEYAPVGRGGRGRGRGGGLAPRGSTRGRGFHRGGIPGRGGSEYRGRGAGIGARRTTGPYDRSSYDGEGRRTAGFGAATGRSSYGEGRSSYGEGRSSYGEGRSSYGEARNYGGEGRNYGGEGRSSYGEGRTYGEKTTYDKGSYDKGSYEKGPGAHDRGHGHYDSRTSHDRSGYKSTFPPEKSMPYATGGSYEKGQYEPRSSHDRTYDAPWSSGKYSG